ncbi:MAG: hypothetical protein ACREXN_12240 [Polaromonas sp.]
MSEKKMNSAVRLIFFLALLISQNIVLAQSIGRTEVKDLPDGWTQLVAYDKKGLSLDNGMAYMPTQEAVFLNKPRNMLLIVESTVGGHGRVSWVSMKCPEIKQNYFTNDYGTNQNRRDTRCLVLNARFSSKTYLTEVYPQAAAAVEKEGLRFEKGQLIRTWSGVPSGTYLKVVLLKTSTIQTESTLGNQGESGVERALVDFGESLHKLVYDSTLSLSGNLSLQLLNSIK